MIPKRELVFWSTIWVILTLLFSSSVNSWVISFYFVTILMPVVLATSIFFNRFLVPRFLLQEKRIKFFLYFGYMLIVSIYLELLVMILAFVILADYQIQNLGKIAGDIYLLTVIMYLVVLVEGLILAVRKLKEKGLAIEALQEKLHVSNQKELVIRSNRKQVLLSLEDIMYIESRGDYVEVHTVGDSHLTKEKISSLDERLPDDFIRIHRSFVVNKRHVSGFNKEEVVVRNHTIPIGRKYKKSAEEQLQRHIIS